MAQNMLFAYAVYHLMHMHNFCNDLITQRTSEWHFFKFERHLRVTDSFSSNGPFKEDYIVFHNQGSITGKVFF